MISSDQISGDDIMEVGLTNTPHWANTCHHSKGGYLFSFTCTSISNGEEGDIIQQKMDVYTHGSKEYPEFCLRYSNSMGDYYAVGQIQRVIERSETDNLYSVLLKLLIRFGQITWQAN